jgi:hypothetical protein
MPGDKGETISVVPCGTAEGNFYNLVAEVFMEFPEIVSRHENLL